MLNNVFIHLSGISDHLELNFFSQFSGYIKNNSVHLLEGIGQGYHSHAHDNILQIRCNLYHLSCCLMEIVQLQSRYL